MLVLHAEVPCNAKAKILTRQQVEILLLPINSNALSLLLTIKHEVIKTVFFLLKSTGKNTADCSNGLPFESNLKTRLIHFTEKQASNFILNQNLLLICGFKLANSHRNQTGALKALNSP